MKAAIFGKYGSSTELEIRETNMPELKAGEVILKVSAFSLNHRDIAIRQGNFKIFTGHKFPKLTGADFLGEVYQSPISSTLKAGDAVYGYVQDLKSGASAEYISIPEKSVCLIPKEITSKAIAAIPCTYLTAMQALRDKAKIKPGQKVVIYGASGGVGTAAIQLAKYYGAEVTAICSTANIQYCLKQRADKVIAYDKGDFFKDLQKDYDIFFQVHSKDGLVYKKGSHILKSDGTFITLIPNPIFEITNLYNRMIGRPKIRTVLVKAQNEDLKFLIGLLTKGAINPQIHREFTLNEIKEAHEFMEKGGFPGKVIVSVWPS